MAGRGSFNFVRSVTVAVLLAYRLHLGFCAVAEPRLSKPTSSRECRDEDHGACSAV